MIERLPSFRDDMSLGAILVSGRVSLHFPLGENAIFYYELWTGTSDPFLPNTKKRDFVWSLSWLPWSFLDDMSWICLPKGSVFPNKPQKSQKVSSPTSPNEFPSFASFPPTFWSEFMRRDLCLFENLTHAGPEAEPFNRGIQKFVGKKFGTRKMFIPW